MNPQHQCRHCGAKITTEEELSKHISAAHINTLTIYTCEICQRQFQYKGSYTDHLKKHSKEDVRYECTECPCFFKNLGHLKNHIKDVHCTRTKTKVYHCKDCSKKFYTKASISQHVRKVHVSVQAMHKCTLCKRIYGSRNSLKWHIHINHNKDFVRSKCPYCPSDFKWPHHLKFHIKKAHIEKGYAPTDLLKKGLSSIRRKTNDCVVCDKKFDKKLDLMLHLQSVHKQELDIYKCCRCTAVFTLKNSLKFHLDEHRKKDPASANHCCQQCHPESNPMLYKAAKTEVEENDDRTEIEKEVIDFELTLMEDEDIRRLIRYRLKHAKRKLSTDQEIVLNELEEFDLFANGISRSSSNVCSDNGINSLRSTNTVVDTTNGKTFNGILDKSAKICLERLTHEELILKTINDTKQTIQIHCTNKFRLQHSLNEPKELCHKANNVLVRNASSGTPVIGAQVSNEREYPKVAPEPIARIKRGKIYECYSCKEKFKKPINLGRHMRLVHGVQKTMANNVLVRNASSGTPVIGAQVSNEREYPKVAPEPIARIKRGKIYECYSCKEKFKKPINLGRHMRLVHGVQKTMANNVLVRNASSGTPVIGAQVSNEREYPKVAPEPIARIKRGKIYECYSCKEKFKKPINLGRHMRLVHGVQKTMPPIATTSNKEKNKQCHLIRRNKNPTSTGALTGHTKLEAVNVATKSRSVIAEVKHVKTLKLYECGTCVLDFKSKLELLRHISDIHMGIRPKTSDSYFCDYCNGKFATKAVISEHLKYH